jgi:hypothetical protein
VATSLPGTLSARNAGHARLYRFDGFEPLGVTKGPSAANKIGDSEPGGLWATAIRSRC